MDVFKKLPVQLLFLYQQMKFPDPSAAPFWFLSHEVRFVRLSHLSAFRFPHLHSEKSLPGYDRCSSYTDESASAVRRCPGYLLPGKNPLPETAPIPQESYAVNG